MATDESKTAEPKCNKCGFVMCQDFDDKPGPHGITLAVPNGKYICYHCKTTFRATGDDDTKTTMTVDQFGKMQMFLSEWAESGTGEDGDEYVKCLVCAEEFGPDNDIVLVIEHLKECNS